MNFRNQSNISICVIEYGKGYPIGHICILVIHK